MATDLEVPPAPLSEESDSVSVAVSSDSVQPGG
jgi:hypothetical protein